MITSRSSVLHERLATVRTMTKCALLGLLCSGCVLGAGPVVGYGKKRGFYAGGAVYGGITMGQLWREVAGTRDGAVWQTRLDGEASKLRTMGWPLGHTDEDKPYPGVRAGIGYGRSNGVGGLAATVGPDV